MTKTGALALDDRDSLLTEIAELRVRLSEAEDVLRAIRSGDLDALVVESHSGPRVFTLQGVDAAASRERGAMLASVSDAVIALDNNEVVTFVNSAAQRLFDLGGNKALGQQLSAVVELQLLKRLVDDRDPAITEWRHETTFASSSGDRLVLEATITDARTTIGESGTLLAIFRDVSARKQAETQLKATNQHLESLLSNAPLGLAYFDAQHRYVRINEVLAQINGIPAVAHIGRTIEDLLPENAKTVVPLLDQIFQTGETFADFEITGETPREPGVKRHWLTGFFPVRDMNGAVTLVGSWVTEITERKRAEEATRDALHLVEGVMSSAPVWIYVIDVVCWRNDLPDDRARQMLGFDEATWRGFGSVFQLMHPKDVGELTQHLARLRKTTATESIDFEYRMRHADGNWRWFLSRDIVYERSTDGEIVKILGTATDITSLKHYEAQVQGSEERLRLATDAAGIGIWAWDPERDHVEWENDWPMKLLGLEPGHEAITAAQFEAEFVHPDDRASFSQAVSRTREAGEAFAFEGRFRRKDGKLRWVQFRGKQVALQGAIESGVLGTARDITDRKEREEHIRLLMREVNHRAKNMLGVVQAVARQTARSTPDEFVARFSQRIHALAASQDVLVNRDWRGADLNDLVRAQLAHFADLLGVRIEIGGEAISVSAAAAQTLGMVLHELATNAGKYGALSNTSGRVAISWYTKNAVGSQKRFFMSWIERDGPPVVAPTRRGFGTAVIDGMAKNGLEAKVHVTYDRAGFQWHLDCPIDQLHDDSKEAQGW